MARMGPGKAHDLGPHDLEPRQRGGQRNGLGQPMLGQPAGLRGLQIRMEDIGAGRPAAGGDGIAQSSPS
jgi:hypothetical protein